jgi:D-arabinose 1-dehydrogenase-like Zn-dependent alcohol dehydrogenase
VRGVCEFCLAGRCNFCQQATMETALGLQADGGLSPTVAVSPKTLLRLPAATGRLEAAWVELTVTAYERCARLETSLAPQCRRLDARGASALSALSARFIN